MNQYILHHLGSFSLDEEYVKILCHTPYLFRNFLLPQRHLPTIEGGFLYLKSKYYDWGGYGLYHACQGGHHIVVNLMISKGIESTTEMDMRRRAGRRIDWNMGLVGACHGGDLDLVNFMIEKGADDWNMGLYHSCLKSNHNLVNLMIEKGADRWNMGLNAACQGGDLDIVNLMIEKGGDAINWNSGLTGACREGHFNLVLFMIEKGADDWPAGLKQACSQGHHDIVKLMIQKGGSRQCGYCGLLTEKHPSLSLLKSI